MSEEKENISCGVELKPLADWVAEESDEGKCRPCAIPEIVEGYRKVFDSAGMSEIVDQLQFSTSDDPEEVCAVLDEMKSVVDDDLRNSLLEVDCKYQEQGGLDAEPEESPVEEPGDTPAEEATSVETEEEAQ